MIYSELVNNLKTLGFGDETDIEDFGDKLYDDINRSITQINLDVCPILAKVEIEIQREDTGYVYIDMDDIITEEFTGDGTTTEFEVEHPIRFAVNVTVDGDIATYTLDGNKVTFSTAPGDEDEIEISYMVYGDPDFLEFADTPVLFEQDGSQFYSRFSDYEIEMGDTMVIDADKNKGKFRVFYKQAHDPFTGSDGEMNYVLPLDLKVHHLVPLLTAYYLWLDDEPAKAAQYYNMYEQGKAEFLDKKNKPKLRVLEGGI